MTYKTSFIYVLFPLIGVTIVLLGLFALNQDIFGLIALNQDDNQAQKIIIDNIIGSYYQIAPRDPLSINSIELNNDILKVKVSFGGGCKDHSFALIASRGFMESDPVQVNVLLSHDASNDLCEALITQDLAFDLSPLKEAWQQAYQQTSGTIIIHLEGGEESISLTYDF
ncbi:MAG: hypothetical protein ACFFC7_13175 [Candidatus Hermodarchaeota archaeon]